MEYYPTLASLQRFNADNSEYSAETFAHLVSSIQRPRKNSRRFNTPKMAIHTHCCPCVLRFVQNMGLVECPTCEAHAVQVPAPPGRLPEFNGSHGEQLLQAYKALLGDVTQIDVRTPGTSGYAKFEIALAAHAEVLRFAPSIAPLPLVCLDIEFGRLLDYVRENPPHLPLDSSVAALA